MSLRVREVGAVVLGALGAVAFINVYVRILRILARGSGMPIEDSSASGSSVIMSGVILFTCFLGAGYLLYQAVGGRSTLKHEIVGRHAFLNPAQKQIKGKHPRLEKHWAVYFRRPEPRSKPAGYLLVQSLDAFDGLLEVELFASRELDDSVPVWLIAGSCLLQSYSKPTPGYEWRDDVPTPEGDVTAIPADWEPPDWRNPKLWGWVCVAASVVLTVIGLALAATIPIGESIGAVGSLAIVGTGFVAGALFWRSGHPVQWHIDGLEQRSP